MSKRQGKRGEGKSKVRREQLHRTIKAPPHTKRKPALLRYAPGGLIPGHTDYVPRVTLAKAKAKPTR